MIYVLLYFSTVVCSVAIMMYSFRRYSLNDNNKNIKLSWKKIRALYNIIPDKFSKGDAWCLKYKQCGSNDTYYLYPPFPFGVIKMRCLMRKIRKRKKIQHDYETMHQFVNCMQKEIDEYRMKTENRIKVKWRNTKK